MGPHGSGLVLDWLWIGPGLALDWLWIGSGLVLDWLWIGSGLVLDWIQGLERVSSWWWRAVWTAGQGAASKRECSGRSQKLSTGGRPTEQRTAGAALWSKQGPTATDLHSKSEGSLHASVQASDACAWSCAWDAVEMVARTRASGKLELVGLLREPAVRAPAACVGMAACCCARALPPCLRMAAGCRPYSCNGHLPAVPAALPGPGLPFPLCGEGAPGV